MDIFVQHDGQRTGPLDEATVRSRLNSGELAPSDIAWREGSQDWLPLDQVLSETAPKSPALKPAPPPPILDTLPDLSDSFGLTDGGELGIARTFGLFKSLDYGMLIPFRTIFSTKLLRLKAVRWVLLLGLFPVVLWSAALSFDLNFQETIWMFEVYFCLFWALYFHSLIRPPAGVWKRAIGYALFTVIIGIPLDLYVQSLPIIRTLYSEAEGGHLIPKIIGFIGGVGLMEETIKILPLLIFGLRQNKIQGVRDGIFLGLISGLGFAAAEGVTYSVGAAIVTSHADSDSMEAYMTAQMLQTMFRMMSGPLLHAAWAGVTGWFVGLSVAQEKTRWPIIAVGIAFMAVLHGINDVVAGTWLEVGTVGLTVLIFMAYLSSEGSKDITVQPSKSE